VEIVIYLLDTMVSEERRRASTDNYKYFDYLPPLFVGVLVNYNDQYEWTGPAQEPTD
jgi:hypothetical protein